jgi:diguanylate cyclase (GGDEF)-like protein
MGSMVVTGAADSRPRGFAFLRTPWGCQLWVGSAVLAALVLPLYLGSWGQQDTPGSEALTGLALMGLSIVNVEIGRLLEGGVSESQRPHKALSAWSFAAALLLPMWWLLPVVVVTYAHARWRGLRVPPWKWIGSAAYVVLAGLAAALTAHAILEGDDLMHGTGLRGLFALLAAAAAFIGAETILFHGSAYLNVADDETWLRRTLRGPSFYLTEGGVLIVGGLSAAIWSGGPWFLVLLLPVYALTQRAALHEPLRERADRDDKTGLLRYESWRRLAVIGVERCVRGDRPWSVLFADLDHFKRFNDSWGHLAGDRALVAVAGAIRGELREGDLLARFGGEEFCVFLPGVGAAEARRIAERARSAVNSLYVADGDRLTMSVGVAAVEAADAEDVELVDALAAADKALFEAKSGGRDTTRVRFVSGCTPSRTAQRAPVRTGH